MEWSSPDVADSLAQERLSGRRDWLRGSALGGNLGGYCRPLGSTLLRVTAITHQYFKLGI